MSTEETKPTFFEEPEPPVNSTHQLGDLVYEAQAGFLPFKNEKGEIEAKFFYMAYHKKGADPETRPLMFCFNGGPGSSSVWLHLGAVGPKLAKMEDDGAMPAPPFDLVDNPDSWLTEFDLVFIDPVGTGYSRAATPELAEKFWGLKGDVESVGEFIRLYLTRNARWRSPLYLVGESYGTTRAAALSSHLVERGIALNGIVLVSSVLNFQTLDFTTANDLPYSLFLPTYAATAWYHKKAGSRRPLGSFLKEVEAFADGEYARALHLGDAMSKAEKKRVTEKLSRYTGLSETYLERANLRPAIFGFVKELRRDAGLTVGRLDSRFTMSDGSENGERMSTDPSMAAIRPPYTACINDWLRRGLGFESDDHYNVLGESKVTGKLWEKWDWGSAREGFPDVAPSLREAFSKNEHMRVMIASGYYDLATPYYATEYTLNHMGLSRWRKQVDVFYYESGHMMYIHLGELKKLKSDLVAWLGASGGKRPS